jgi:hypothetical protein
MGASLPADVLEPTIGTSLSRCPESEIGEDRAMHDR